MITCCLLIFINALFHTIFFSDKKLSFIPFGVICPWNCAFDRYYRMFEATQNGLGRNAPVHSIHGSLLAVGELLRFVKLLFVINYWTGEFWVSYLWLVVKCIGIELYLCLVVLIFGLYLISYYCLFQVMPYSVHFVCTMQVLITMPQLSTLSVSSPG